MAVRPTPASTQQMISRMDRCSTIWSRFCRIVSVFAIFFLHLDAFIAGVPLTRKSFAGRPDCDHKSDGCRCRKERELCWQVSRSLLSLVSCLSCWQEGLSLFQKDNITRRWIAPCLLQTAEVVSTNSLTLALLLCFSILFLTHWYDAQQAVVTPHMTVHKVWTIPTARNEFWTNFLAKYSCYVSEQKNSPRKGNNLLKTFGKGSSLLFLISKRYFFGKPVNVDQPH